MTTRLTRAEQVGRNRGLLLDAARRTFLRRGYAGATLEAIAEEAGFSKGVVYSQFASKADLFLALLEQRITERAEENARLVAEQPGTQGLRALMRRNAARSAEAGDWSHLLIEFRVIAARDPELNARYATLHARSSAEFAEALRTAMASHEPVNGFSVEALAGLMFAVDTGAVLERAADPAALPPQLLEDLLVRLVTSP